jgi:hypothetical protein
MTSCVVAKCHLGNHTVRDAAKAAHRQRRKCPKAGRETVLPGHDAANPSRCRPRRALPAVLRGRWPQIRTGLRHSRAVALLYFAAVFASGAVLTFSNYAFNLWN